MGTALGRISGTLVLVWCQRQTIIVQYQAIYFHYYDFHHAVFKPIYVGTTQRIPGKTAIDLMQMYQKVANRLLLTDSSKSDISQYFPLLGHILLHASISGLIYHWLPA